MNLQPVFDRVLGALQTHTPVIVGLDGRSGSGKTTLSEQLRDGLAERGLSATMVHLEELYPGWDGLAATPALARDWVLAPLRTGAPARFRRWDWEAGRFEDDWQPVSIADVIVLEGVGALAPELRPLLDVAVWLELPAEQRYARAMARDGELYRPHWQRWADQEEDYLRQHDPVGFAQVVITGQRCAEG